MKVTVFGIGRIGLPMAASLARAGHEVVGVDIDERRVELVNRGENPNPDEAGLAELLREVVAAGALRATSEGARAAARAEVILFSVAVDVDEEGKADLRSLLAACRTAAEGLQRGTLCIFDTTLPVGTTRRQLVPALAASGLTPGDEFSVAFSPERLFMGRVLRDITAYPKVVGGLDARSAERAAAFFRDSFGVDVLVLSSLEAAELSKLAEGAYRDLNIALANELAQVADAFGVDVMEVIGAANSQPFCHLHVPGTGVGGHCIPVYPRFLVQSNVAGRLSALGREVNDAMPAYAVERLAQVLGSLVAKRVLLLGVTFRPNVSVTAHTNALDLLRELTLRGAIVEAHDALLSEDEVRRLGFRTAREPFGTYDAVVVHACHDAYRGLDWGRIAPILFDARNALDPAAVTATGAAYLGVGRPLRNPAGASFTER